MGKSGASEEHLKVALILSLALQIQPFAAYWIAPDLVALLLAFVVGWIFALGAAVYALVVLFRKQWKAAAVLVAGLAAFALVPYNALSMHMDFLLRVDRMSAIAAVAQHDPPFQPAVGDGAHAWELPQNQRGLAEQGHIFIVPSSCGAFVFFPTFFGIPDGVGGFLFVPECATPEDFPPMWGDNLRWYTQLSPRWWRMGGT